MARATWNGTVIAESDAVVSLEGNLYFPPDSVKREYLRDSPTRSACPWKGEDAVYYHLEVDGKTLRDAAWCYPRVYEAAQAIEGHFAFWRGVVVTP